MLAPLLHNWRSQPTLNLPFPKGRRAVLVSHIVRFEGHQNYTQCFFSDGSSLLVALTMKTLLERLPPDALIRIHRKHAVNPNYVVEWNAVHNYVRLQSGDQLTIARRRNDLF